MATNRTTRIYSDFDLNFKPHPLTGDIVKKYDGDAIKRAIKQLVLLNAHEKHFHPEIAGRINELLFEPMGRGTATGIESRITFLIKQYEKRAELISVVAEPDFIKNHYEVTINFRIKNQLQPIEQTILLERVR